MCSDHRHAHNVLPEESRREQPTAEHDLLPNRSRDHDGVRNPVLITTDTVAAKNPSSVARYRTTSHRLTRNTRNWAERARPEPWSRRSHHAGAALPACKSPWPFSDRLSPLHGISPQEVMATPPSAWKENFKGPILGMSIKMDVKLTLQNSRESRHYCGTALYRSDAIGVSISAVWVRRMGPA